ncbi:cytochrome c biogenesis protein CcmG/thiol:disulfide interchange protein DsbE [Pelomonas saccharophila]|uniref:Cytochrome c biogenesis protein CcmG/thiol:disulfide interchange protein DsbE n=1 Tax=Roseateles saccharophilus TaxID=304 RepID=A0ABU1YUS3_ROSSA|nr:DsbE family thiol:disulfide interchange protein [Roseateles saccharophilus]MDR7272620.1 cytochrome c biogenesis protein CcmG/thiol:disulfide interchange protein DsbE [Roseateles saccharophilus]
MKLKLAALIPLLASAALVALLARGLNRDARAETTSPLIGKPAPALDLERLDGEAQALQGQVWVLNVFASWCGPCRTELPVLGQLAQQGGVRIVGLDYRDTPELGLAFLKRHGNPYALTWLDPLGQGSLAWGITGVPETFVIDRRGIVRLRHTGPVTAQDLNQRLLPLIERLKRA